TATSAPTTGVPSLWRTTPTTGGESVSVWEMGTGHPARQGASRSSAAMRADMDGSSNRASFYTPQRLLLLPQRDALRAGAAREAAISQDRVDLFPSPRPAVKDRFVALDGVRALSCLSQSRCKDLAAR